MRVTLIHNPKAGERQPTAEALREMLAAAGHEVFYQSSKAPKWRAALRREADLLVVAGGDGTVAKVFKAHARSAGPVTILPFGSGNNIARSLGFPISPAQQLIKAWPRAQRRRFALGAITSRQKRKLFVEAVGGGVFAEVLEQAALQASHPDGPGKVAFGVDLFRRAAAEAEPVAWEISIDGKEASGEYIAVEVMNIREFGPNLPLAARSVRSKGRFEVLLVAAEQRPKLLRLADSRAASRSDAGLLPRRSGSLVEIRPRDRALLHVDDKLWAGGARRRRRQPICLTAGAAWLDLLVPPAKP